MPVTIHDVAKKAKVGIGTVSSVLNNSRPVNEKTRSRVLAAIAELEFVPNPSGRRLSMGKTHTIGAIIPFFTRPSHVERLRGFMSVIAGSGYDIALFSVETISQRKTILGKVPRRGRVDGLVIFSMDPLEEDVKRIQREDIPTVLVEADHPELDSIVLDDIAAARTAVQHLIELGHHKIAFVNEFLNDPFGFPFSAHRYQGYCQALQQANIPLKANYHCQGLYSREAGHQMALELLNLPDPPTAIFAYSDILALGVLEAARERAVPVPQALSVVGYDDIELANFAQLTTVRQHLFDSGAKGVELLLQIIADPDRPISKIQLPTELIVRQTTAPPPA